MTYKNRNILVSVFLSERPDSNWQHSAWKAYALRTELLLRGKERIANTELFLSSTVILVSKN
tara:strand:- start:639 stop:824 length:186 start_codon:yes stop_codon:yes gene_type:complete